MKKIIILLFLISLIACKAQKQKNGNKLTSIQNQKKNVLFIVVDDLTTTLGCYGNKAVLSPHIDALAKDGILFDNAYCNYAVCNPSRTSFLTGLKPETTTVMDNKTPLLSILGDKVTLPALYKSNGYQTVSYGKIFHKSNKGYNDPKAWDIIKDYKTTKLGLTGKKRNMTNGALKWCRWLQAEGTDEDQEDGMIARDAVKFLKSKREKPFFLALGFKKPHDPFNAPKKYFDYYPMDEVKIHELPKDWVSPTRLTLPSATKIFDKFTDQDKKEFTRAYYACTTFMDAQVGKVIETLKETGEYENTLIVFLSDHGYHLGEHNWWNKVTLFEQGSNAPFIVSGNLVKHKGVKSNSMFEYIDIYPTLADFSNLNNTPNYIEGQSFKELLDAPNKPFRTEVRAVIKRGKILGKSVKNKKWRYVQWDKGEVGEELYNQETDPLEYKNLANDVSYSDIKKQMEKLLNLE